MTTTGAGRRAGATPRVRLRPAVAADTDFLVALYGSTRADELSSVPWPQEHKDAFVRQQYDAQDAHFTAAFPGADRWVVEVDGQPAGRLFVDRTDAELRVVDVALLPPWRGRGIGTRLLRDLLSDAAAAGLPVRLHVLAGNPARRLYERMGFRSTGWAGSYEAMEAMP